MQLAALLHNFREHEKMFSSALSYLFRRERRSFPWPLVLIIITMLLHLLSMHGGNYQPANLIISSFMHAVLCRLRYGAECIVIAIIHPLFCHGVPKLQSKRNRLSHFFGSSPEKSVVRLSARN